MAQDKEETQDNRWHLDKKVSVTHIFATISAISAVVVFGSNLNTRLSIVENGIATVVHASNVTDERQDRERAEIARQVREDLRLINDKLDRLIMQQRQK